MGNDGGSIPTRRELVKEAARNPTVAQLKETLHEQQEHLWNTDPLSHRRLSHPVVSDALGRLFNKDSIIEFLLPPDDANSRVDQETLMQGLVKSLKDVVEVKFEIDEAATELAKARKEGERRVEKWVCPITRQELGPKSKAVYLVPCGHAFSGVAVKEVSGSYCVQCNASYASNDVIPIVPASDLDIARLTSRVKMLKEQGLAHSLKSAAGSGKKRKKNATEVEILTDTNGTADRMDPLKVTKLKKSNEEMDTSKVTTPQPRSGTSTPRPNTSIKNAATASLTAKVLEEQEERNKRRKMDKNNNINSLFSSTSASSGKKGRDIDFMNRGFALTDGKH